MDVAEISKKFLRWEKTNELHSIKINDFPIYCFIRLEVFESLIFSGNIEDAIKKNNKDKVKINYFKVLKSACSFFAKQHILKNKTIYITNTDNKIKIEDTYVDNYFDKLIRNDVSAKAILEYPNLLNYHFNNISNKSITVKAGIFYILERMFKGKIVKEEFNSKVNRIIEMYSGLYYDLTGSTIPKEARNLIRNKIYTNVNRIKLYENILKFYKPKEVYLKSAYSPLKLIITKACKKNKVQVTEVQHGHIYKYHIGYLLPLNDDLDYLNPDKILVWSEYYKGVLLGNKWKEEKIFVKGDFTYNSEVNKLNQEKEEGLVNLSEKYDKVFTIVGQHTLTSEIIDFLSDLDRLPHEVKVFLKLHPKHIDLQEREYEKIYATNKKLTIVKEGKIKSLINASDLVIGVYSTAIIEALEMKKKVHLIDISTADFFEDMIKKGIVRKSNSIYNSFQILKSSSPVPEVIFREKFKSTKMKDGRKD
ncbi:hypothetical protein [Hyunsoonleella rubra]|uniref:Capsule biosynthesis protein n=1 Tax=Hyunsoonleella rubra TaxID=1737062 RepID=A0ABW5T705_9FLAO